jgi:hypothetical protein
MMPDNNIKGLNTGAFIHNQLKAINGAKNNHYITDNGHNNSQKTK